MRVFRGLDEITSAAGQHLGVTQWMQVDQQRVDQFADATADHQWIHVDPDRAATGPFGGTIAHGFLTLSLVSWFGAQTFAFDLPCVVVNYGLNRVRFPAAVRAGSRIRASVDLGEVVETAAGLQIVVVYAVTAEGSARPACVAETLLLLVPIEG